jgi:hypothetical protein
LTSLNRLRRLTRLYGLNSFNRLSNVDELNFRRPYPSPQIVCRLPGLTYGNLNVLGTCQLHSEGTTLLYNKLVFDLHFNHFLTHQTPIRFLFKRNNLQFSCLRHLKLSLYGSLSLTILTCEWDEIITFISEKCTSVQNLHLHFGHRLLHCLYGSHSGPRSCSRHCSPP